MNSNYLLHIELNDIQPSIWRRFTVPEYYTLDRLHDVIQIVMGWKDYHLYSFTVNGIEYTEEPESKEDGEVAGMQILSNLHLKQKDKITYLYDFGDSWFHTITIENMQEVLQPLDDRLTCIDGGGACPIEDVGGVPGYYRMCEAMKHKRSKEYLEYIQWLQQIPWYKNEYDPSEFNKEYVNMELAKYERWSRPRCINYTYKQ